MLLATAPRSNSKSHASSSPVSVEAEMCRGCQIAQLCALPKATPVPNPNQNWSQRPWKERRGQSNSFCDHNSVSCPLIQDTPGVYANSELWLCLGAGSHSHKHFAALYVKLALPFHCISSCFKSLKSTKQLKYSWFLWQIDRIEEVCNLWQMLHPEKITLQSGFYGCSDQFCSRRELSEVHL